MVVKPHDLLKIKGPEDIYGDSFPLWAKESLKAAPYVVVRRACIEEGKIPVGIRGEDRSQRHGCFLFESSILAHITPEQLVKKERGKFNPINSNLKAFQSLQYVEDIFNHYSFSWGPGGSVGFELASGYPAVHETSDLDIIIQAPQGVSVSMAASLLEKVNNAPSRIDIQVETTEGALSLVEIARGRSPIMIRKKDGPYLIENTF